MSIRSFFLSLLVAAFSIVAYEFLPAQPQSAKSDPEPWEGEEMVGDRAAVFREDRIDPRTGRLRSHERLNAYRTMMRTMPPPRMLPAAKRNHRGIGPASTIFGTRWVPLGPDTIVEGQSTCCTALNRINVSGRTSSMALDPVDPNIMYVMGAQGGVWRSDDGGVSWQPKSDFEASLAGGCVVVDPSDRNRLIAGTGEAHYSGDSYYGAGLLLSTNGGDSWEHRPGPFDIVDGGGAYIARVAIDRGDGDHVLVASSFGLFRSTDAFAENWTEVGSGLWDDVVQDVEDPSVWYATNIYSGFDSVSRSTDGGQTFLPLAGSPQLSAIRFHLTQSRSNPQILYAVAATASNAITVYKSTDRGASWNAVTADPASYRFGSQYSYNLHIEVNPFDPNTVSIGGVRQFLTRDGGATWSDIASDKTTHDDHHFGLWHPTQPGTLFNTNDGGVFKSTDYGETWQSLNNGLQLTQFVAIALNPQNEFEVLGGTQDNGTNIWTGTPMFTHVADGDGGYCGYDPQNPNIAYYQYIRGYFSRSDVGPYLGAWMDKDLPNAASGNEFRFYAPMAISDANPALVVVGGRSIWRSTNRMDDWFDAGREVNGNGAKVRAIALDPTNANIAYVGFEAFGSQNQWGRIYRSDDFLADTPTWTLLNAGVAGLEGCGGSVSLVLDPADPNHLVAVRAGFGSGGSCTGRIFETTNARAASPAWVDKTADLPNVPVSVLVIDPADSQTWYAGTDLGIYRTTDAGASWHNYSTDLPIAWVRDLKIDGDTNTLVASVYGRGLWQVSKPQLEARNLAVVDGGAQDNGALDPGETAGLQLLLRNGGTEPIADLVAHATSLTPGITVAAGAVSWGTIGTNAEAFNAVPLEVSVGEDIPCGSEAAIELFLTGNDGLFERSARVSFRVGVETQQLVLNADFESGDNGFTKDIRVGADRWERNGVRAASGSFAWQGKNTDTANDSAILSPALVLPNTPGADLFVRFKHTYYTESPDWDGAVLEIRRAPSGFGNAATAQGVQFVSEMPMTPLNPFSDNPRTGQIAYTGGRAGQPFRTVEMRLDPAQWAGQTMQLKWSVASDGYLAFSEPGGWFIDDVQVGARSWTCLFANVGDGWIMR